MLPNLALVRLGVYEETGKLIGHRIMRVEGLRPGEGTSFLTVVVRMPDYICGEVKDIHCI